MQLIRSVFVLLSAFLIKDGLAKIKPTITEGSFVKIEEYPYSASVHMITKENPEDEFEKWYNGIGSILTEYIILTSVRLGDKRITDAEYDHESHTYKTLLVSVGSNNKIRGSHYTVSEYETHEHYDHNTFKNNIALLKLQHPLEFDNQTNSLNILKPSFCKSKNSASFAGWGNIIVPKLHKNGTAKNDPSYRPETVYLSDLKDLKIWSRKECLKRFKDYIGPHVIAEGNFCAGYEDKSKGSGYDGDYGGALVVEPDTQIGISSWYVSNKKSSKSLTPRFMVYTDVASYYDWIEINKEKLCANDTCVRPMYDDDDTN